MTNKLDVNFDFTTDTPNYWEGFWEKDEVLGGGAGDPDVLSETLKIYHQYIWSKQLPNGEFLDLTKGAGYLTWKNFRFGSDSIVASFRYKRYRTILEKVKNSMTNYKSYIEGFLRKGYTIGGSIIFPKRRGGINQSRGFNTQISDRWDLTLECIRKYYNNEQSPLYDVLLQDKPFFDLFVNFKGYIDFWHLQDCVTPDYESVIFWIGNGDFTQSPFPQTINEYLQWIEKELDFVKNRNTRIEIALSARKNMIKI